MLKFFRNIRQKLLSENKIRKYLAYAVGEIFLVVIGILIALSINNWNEGRQERAQEQLILKQLKSEYENNLLQLEQKILMRNQALEACNTLLNFIDATEELDEEVLLTSLGTIGRDPTFDPIKNDIIGSEKIRMIQNDTLVRFLSNWSSEVYQVQEMELDFKKFRTEQIFPSYIRLGVSRNLSHNLWKDGYTPTEALDENSTASFALNPTQKSLVLEDVLQDVELEGIISHVITYHQITNIQSQTLRERILDILQVIEWEIID